MNRRWIVLALGLLTTIWAISAAPAWGQSRATNGPPPLLEPLDRLGSLLLGIPSHQQVPPKARTHNGSHRDTARSSSRGSNSGRTSTAGKTTTSRTRNVRVASTPNRPTLMDAIMGRPPVRGRTQSAASATRSSAKARSRAAGKESAARTASNSDSADTAPLPAGKLTSGSKHAGTAGQSPHRPASRSVAPSEKPPLYRRLESLVDSPFTEPETAATNPDDSDAAGPSHQHANDHHVAAEAAGAETDNTAEPPQKNDLPASDERVPHLAHQPNDAGSEPAAPNAAESGNTKHASVGSAVDDPSPVAMTGRSAVPVESEKPSVVESSAEPSAENGTEATLARDPLLPKSPQGQSPSAPAPATEHSEGTTQPASTVLLTQRAPSLKVQAAGPARITVGSEAVYKVQVANSGQVKAEGVVVRVEVPRWASIQRAEASEGTARIGNAMPSGLQQILWEIPQLGPEQEKTLLVHLIPRESRPLQLLVDWDYKRAPFQAVIHVQEPKLELALRGPEEVHRGQTAGYMLEIRNVGNGNATQVTVAITGDTAGSITPARQVIEQLAPGESKTMELKLVARQSGVITLQAHASTQNGQHTHLVRRIEVVQPALTISVDAPPVQYAQTEVMYRIHVTNSGNAPARDVRVAATVPPEAEVVATDELCRRDEKTGRLVWQLEELPPGRPHTLTATCRYAKPGIATLVVQAEGAEQLAARAEAAVRIEGFADLGVILNDPAKPVPVGTEAEYEVVVENRGTQAAENVELVVFFSQGIEPVSAHGAKHVIAPGQVVFDALESLAPGQKHTFRVVAQAATPGNHVCRAEVTCKHLDIRMVRDEVTRFYAAGAPTVAERSLHSTQQ